MTGAERLLECFQAGRLLRPSAENLNFVDLVGGLLRLAGVEQVAAGAGVERICRLIGPADHYVLVLVDGMGTSALEKLPPGSFLRSHLAEQLLAVFPPTTAAAMTTLATARWPGEHGVPTWWIYLERFGLSAVSLRFAERFTERPLEQYGVPADEVFPLPSVWPAAKHQPLTVIGAGLAQSTFTRYAGGETARAGYLDIPEALELVVRRVAAARSPTFTYVYLPQLDAIGHRKGIDTDEAAALLAGLDAQLADLASRLAARARLVVTADHGMADIPPERTFILEEDDPLMSHLLCPPTGEPTVPICHIHSGHEQAFTDLFACRFGEAFFFLTPSEAEELHLFGPGPLSPVTHRRLGTLFGIAPQPAAIYFRPRQGEFFVHVGVHAGMSPQEMQIPLILA